MVNEKKKFWTIGQIDATGVRGPHEKELEDMSRAKYQLFVNLDMSELETIILEDLGGKIENIGFNEDWTISIEFFPEVNIHFAYSYFGGEFGDDIEAEFKFYFSGERAIWVPGEDSATYIDIVMDFLERKIKGELPFEKSYNTKSDMMERVLLQRSTPFQFLREEDKRELEDFIKATISISNSIWHIKKEIFPKIFIEITWNPKQVLDITYFGENLEKSLSSYHIELIGVFVINHILRYITIKYKDEKLPDICYIMFSRLYTKEKNWKHRRN